MKNLYFLTLILLIPAFTGCKFAEKIGNALYDPVVSTQTYTTNKVALAERVLTMSDGTTKTNIVETLVEVPVTVTSTNEWVLNPTLKQGIVLAGDVAPFPWAGPISTALLSFFGIGAHLIGRKYKKAAVAGVQAADEFRKALKSQPDGMEADKQVAQSLKVRQLSSGTYGTIKTLLNQL